MMLQQRLMSSAEYKSTNYFKRSATVPKNTRIIRPKVLLVEDNALIQYTFKLFLQNLNCDVDIVENGQSALTQFNNTYHLMLLDIGLPDMNGIELCKKLYHSYHEVTVPIVGLTAYGEDIKQECLTAGMSDFAVKPLLLETLKKLLEYWIPRYIAPRIHEVGE